MATIPESLQAPSLAPTLSQMQESRRPQITSTSDRIGLTPEEQARVDEANKAIAESERELAKIRQSITEKANYLEYERNTYGKITSKDLQEQLADLRTRENKLTAAINQVKQTPEYFGLSPSEIAAQELRAEQRTRISGEIQQESLKKYETETQKYLGLSLSEVSKLASQGKLTQEQIYSLSPETLKVIGVKSPEMTAELRYEGPQYLAGVSTRDYGSYGGAFTGPPDSGAILLGGSSGQYTNQPIFSMGFPVPESVRTIPTTYPSGTMQGYGGIPFSISTQIGIREPSLTGLSVPIGEGQRAETESTSVFGYGGALLAGTPIFGGSTYLPEYAQQQRARQKGWLSPGQVLTARKKEEEYINKQKELNKILKGLDKELTDVSSEEEKIAIIDKYNKEIREKGFVVNKKDVGDGRVSFDYVVASEKSFNLITWRGYQRKQIADEKPINIPGLTIGDLKAYRTETIQADKSYNTIFSKTPVTVRPKNLLLSASIVGEEVSKTFLAGEALGFAFGGISKGYGAVKTALGADLTIEGARFLPKTARVIADVSVKGAGEEGIITKAFKFAAPKASKTALVAGTGLYGALEGGRYYTLQATGQKEELQNFPYEVAGRVLGFGLLGYQSYKLKEANKALEEAQLLRKAQKDIKIREAKAMKEAIKSGGGEFIPAEHDVNVRQVGFRSVVQPNELDNLVLAVKKKAGEVGVELTDEQIKRIIMEKGFYEQTTIIRPGRGAVKEVGGFAGAEAFPEKTLKRYGVELGVISPDSGKGIAIEFSYNRGRAANVIVKPSVVGADTSNVITQEFSIVRRSKLHPEERLRLERTTGTQVSNFQRMEELPITKGFSEGGVTVEKTINVPVPKEQKVFGFSTETRLIKKRPYGKEAIPSKEALKLGLTDMSSEETKLLYERAGKTRAIGRFSNIRFEKAAPVTTETGIPGIRLADERTKFLQMGSGQTDFPLGTRLADINLPAKPDTKSLSRAMKPFSPSVQQPEEISIFDKVFGPVGAIQEKPTIESIRQSTASNLISPRALGRQIGIPREVVITKGINVAPSVIRRLGRYRGELLGQQEERLRTTPTSILIGQTRQVTVPQEKGLEISKVPSMLGGVTIVREDTSQIEQSRQAQPQPTQPRQREQPIQVMQPSPRIGMPMEVMPMIEKPGTIETPFIFGWPDREKKFIKKQKAYVAEVYVDATKKQKAHYEPVTEQPLTLMSALSAAARVVDRTISARGRVREVKTTKQPANTGDRYFEVNRQKFRSYSGKKQKPLPTGTFIEKQRFRADSPGETMALQKGKQEKARIRSLFGM